MTNQDYLKALKKALAAMNSASRDDIIREIQSYIDESGSDSQSLTERFGAPETLAQQYLEGEPVLSTPLPAKAGGVMKRVIMWVGGSVIVLALLIAGMLYWLTQDAFDYADETAAELTDESRNWREMSLSGAADFELDQSKAVFYWYDQAQVRLSCKGEDNITPDEQGSIKLRHKDCLVYVPQQTLMLKATQADIILVRPRADVNATTLQTRVRIAEGDNGYRYVIDAQRSNAEELKSDAEAAVQISIQGSESNLGLYEH